MVDDLNVINGMDSNVVDLTYIVGLRERRMEPMVFFLFDLSLYLEARVWFKKLEFWLPPSRAFCM